MKHLLLLLLLSPLLLASSAVNFSTVGNLGGVQAKDWSAYTPTYTGFGTVASSSMFWRRNGDSIEIKGTFTSGTVSGSTAAISLPSGLTVDTTKYSTSFASYHGRWVRNNGSANTVKGGDILVPTGGGNALNFSYDDYTSAVNPLTAQTGSLIFGNSQDIEVDVTGIPISGWSSTSPSGSTSSVTSSGANYRTDSAVVSSTCSSSPCTIASQSGSWLTSISRTGAGSYTLNITSGEFSAAPTCVCSSVAVGTPVTCASFVETSATAISFTTYTTSGTATDGQFAIICMGPH